MSVTMGKSMHQSPQNDENNVPLEILHEGFTYVLMEQSHPDMTWITERPYQKGVLTKDQILAFNKALITGLIPETPTDQ